MEGTGVLLLDTRHLEKFRMEWFYRQAGIDEKASIAVRDALDRGWGEA